MTYEEIRTVLQHRVNRMLVRGCVTVHTRGMVENEIIAYTHWYRHDDDLSQLVADFESLIDCYWTMRYTDSISYGYEYKNLLR